MSTEKGVEDLKRQAAETTEDIKKYEDRQFSLWAWHKRLQNLGIATGLTTLGFFSIAGLSLDWALTGGCISLALTLGSFYLSHRSKNKIGGKYEDEFEKDHPRRDGW